MTHLPLYALSVNITSPFFLYNLVWLTRDPEKCELLMLQNLVQNSNNQVSGIQPHVFLKPFRYMHKNKLCLNTCKRPWTLWTLVVSNVNDWLCTRLWSLGMPLTATIAWIHAADLPNTQQKGASASVIPGYYLFGKTTTLGSSGRKHN